MARKARTRVVVDGDSLGRIEAGNGLREDFGLPDRQALLELAATYLEQQRRLWKGTPAAEWLPPAGPDSVKLLAAAFEADFLAGKVTAFKAPSKTQPIRVGGGYLRYSCDNSNPRSLDQQLINCLLRARNENVFIPWSYVMADAAVTGTIAARRGYKQTKLLIETPALGMDVLFVDEVGRASRDMIEAIKLGKLVDECNKRMVGVSDGYDSSNPMAKIILALFAALNALFIEQLRSKVNRGMADAFLNGRNILPPAMGYKLIPILDFEGSPVVNQNGKVDYQKVIDPDEAEVVREVFERYALKHQSPMRIARDLNDRGSCERRWDCTVIKKILTRETYIGIEHYKQTWQTRDDVTGTVKVHRRDRSEWLTREVPDLRIITDELWQKTKQRLEQCRRADRKPKEQPSRTEVYPTTLFRPVCDCCGQLLFLGKSGKYPVFCCNNGRQGKHGCTLKSYKSIRIVEDSLLSCVKATVFDQVFANKLVEGANAFLAAEAVRPTQDLTPLKKQLKTLQTKERRCVTAIESADGDRMAAVVKRAQELNEQIAALKETIKTAERQNTPAPPALCAQDVELLLGDLRGLLSEEVAVAAPILAKLTGPIRVKQLPRKPGYKHGNPWTASFKLNGAAMLLDLAERRNCPTALTLEYLNNRGWTMPQPVEIPLEPMTAAMYFAPQAIELAKAGLGVQAIAESLATTTEIIRDVLRSAKADGGNRACSQSGRTPTWWTGTRGPKAKNPPKYIEHGPEITRLYDQEELSFERIGAKLKMSPMTATKSYDDLLASSLRVPPMSANSS